MQKRIAWIDIAKFFGIFAIYLGHFGAEAGRSFYFVFSHHVALFFFLSGCMENYNKEENFLRYLQKKIKSIMIPFWVFSALSAIVSVIHRNLGWDYAKALTVEIARGVVRNTFIAGSLWFLTCLFVMQILFFFIRKLRHKPLVFLVSVAIYVFANEGLNPHPLWQPSMYYNVDSALYYLIYYTIGYLVFPYVLRLFELNSTRKRMIFSVTAIGSFLYTMAIFFEIDLSTRIPFPEWSGSYVAVATTCLMIYFYLVVAKLLEDVSVLAELGKNTLYLCGSEYIIKEMVLALAGTLGLTIGINNPLGCYIYTAILLVAADKCLVPAEKYIVNKIVRNNKGKE